MMSCGSTTDDGGWLLCRREQLRVDPPLLNVPVRDTDKKFGLLSLPLSSVPVRVIAWEDSSAK